MNNMRCAVCDSNSIEVSKVDSETVKNSLSLYFASPVPDDLYIMDYAICRCNFCGSETAFPRVPGNRRFYEWIASQETYYTNHRWEYDIVLKMIESTKMHGLDLIDLGCGNGYFMDLASKVGNITSYGIDLNADSVAECKSKGLNVDCMSVFEYSQTRPNQKFDFVVSFHCLEHLENINEFICSAKVLLKSGGVILISVPSSPMFFEMSWFDPLNNPPHHLNRFSTASFIDIAKRQSMECDLIVEKAPNLFHRTLKTFALVKLGPAIRPSFLQLIVSACKDPLSFLDVFLKQVRWGKRKNAGVTILAKLSIATD